MVVDIIIATALTMLTVLFTAIAIRPLLKRPFKPMGVEQEALHIIIEKKSDWSVSEEGQQPVFGDPLSTTVQDPIHSIAEERFITLGQSRSGKIVVVAHMDKNDTIRIISARPASKREKRDYEER